MSALREAIRRDPLIWRGVQLSAAAALGAALPDLITLARAVCS